MSAVISSLTYPSTVFALTVVLAISVIVTFLAFNSCSESFNIIPFVTVMNFCTGFIVSYIVVTFVFDVVSAIITVLSISFSLLPIAFSGI